MANEQEIKEVQLQIKKVLKHRAKLNKRLHKIADELEENEERITDLEAQQQIHGRPTDHRIKARNRVRFLITEETNIELDIDDIEHELSQLRQRLHDLHVQNVNQYFNGRSELDILQEGVIRLLPERLDEGGQPPAEVQQCRKLLRNLFVYIYDYTNGLNEKLSSHGALLRKCLSDHRGFFPKEAAKSEGLKILLRDFSNFRR